MLFNQMTRPHYPVLRARTNMLTTQLSSYNGTPWPCGEAGEKRSSIKLDIIENCVGKVNEFASNVNTLRNSPTLSFKR